MTSHGYSRATERIAMTYGLAIERIATSRAENYAPTAAVDTAIRVYIDAAHKVWAGASNGDTVVAIVRNRRVVTYMLRRASQPFTPDAFNVERVIDATKGGNS